MTPQNPRYVRQLWLLLGWLMVGAIVYLSLVPGPQAPQYQGADKVQHAFAYGTLMFWFAQAHLQRRWTLVALACMLLGIALEYGQGMLGYRSFSYADMAANATGVVLGFMIARAGPDNCIERVERWVYGTPG